MPYCMLKGIGDASNERLCFFDDVPKGTQGESFRYRMGLEWGADYPEDARLYMERKHPGVRLTSYIGNTMGLLLVSKELRELLERHCSGEGFEYLPVTIYDHKKRPYSSDYTIVHALGTVDCADERKSVITYTSSGKISLVKKLVISEKKVKEAPPLFRPLVKPGKLIFGPALVEEIRKGKFTNVTLEELESTPG